MSRGLFFLPTAGTGTAKISQKISLKLCNFHKSMLNNYGEIDEVNRLTFWFTCIILKM